MRYVVLTVLSMRLSWRDDKGCYGEYGDINFIDWALAIRQNGDRIDRIIINDHHLDNSTIERTSLMLITTGPEVDDFYLSLVL